MDGRRLPIVLLALVLATPALAADPVAKPGPYEVATLREAWKDAKRDNRELPYKIYYPKDLPADKAAPVIIFSHGLGGTRDGYEYLGKHWASWGYVSVHLTHHGSDIDALRGRNPMTAARESAADIQNSIDRVKDVTFAIDQVTAINKDGTLKIELDLDHIGMAGHSFGGSTTMRVIGQRSAAPLLPDPFKNAPADSRIKAAIPMSAPTASGRDLANAYGSITVPTLIMTGTLDDSPVGNTKAKDRLVPFPHMKAADRFMLVLDGGDHMVFSGAKRNLPAIASRPGSTGDRAKDPRFHDLILLCTTRFWDANLRGDAAAREFLEKGGFEKQLGKDGTWVHKAEGS